MSALPTNRRAGRCKRRVHGAGDDHTYEVRGLAAFDLDDLGTVLGEKAAHLDARDAHAEVQNTDAREREARVFDAFVSHRHL
jgi:hypothetical protein